MKGSWLWVSTLLLELKERAPAPFLTSLVHNLPLHIGVEAVAGLALRKPRALQAISTQLAHSRCEFTAAVGCCNRATLNPDQQPALPGLPHDGVEAGPAAAVPGRDCWMLVVG